MAPATKRGAFPSPAGRLYGFIKTGAFYNLEALHRHLLNPLNLLNPGAERRLNPHARKGVSIEPSSPSGLVHKGLVPIVKFMKFNSEVTVKLIVKLM